MSRLHGFQFCVTIWEENVSCTFSVALLLRLSRILMSDWASGLLCFFFLALLFLLFVNASPSQCLVPISEDPNELSTKSRYLGVHPTNQRASKKRSRTGSKIRPPELLKDVLQRLHEELKRSGTLARHILTGFPSQVSLCYPSR